MKEIIDSLKDKEIIYEHSIEVLKNYINKKFPSENESYRARVFADAIHKIIDDHIREFRRDDQKAIKRSLLTNAVDKNSFEINAYDIMKTCVSLDMDEEEFLEDLSSWLNHQQDIPIQREALEELTHIVEEEIRQETLQTSEPFDFDLDKPTIFDEPDEPIIEESIIEEPEEDSFIVDDEYGIDTSKVEVSNSFEDDLMAQLEAAFAEVEDTTPTVYETVVFDQDGKEESHFDNEDIDALFEDVTEEKEPEKTAGIEPSHEIINREEDVLEEPEEFEEEDFVDETEASFAAMSEVEDIVEVHEEDVRPDEPIMVSMAGPSKKAKTDEAPDWNMFNLADVMFDEEKDGAVSEAVAEETVELNDEGRPVIKVEMERQMDVLEEQKKDMEVPVEQPSATIKERYREWIDTGKYKDDLKMAVPILLGFVALVIVLYYIINNVQLTPTPEAPAPEPVESEQMAIPEERTPVASIEEPVEKELVMMADPMNLHPSLRYKEIDKEALITWLDRNNSMLAEEEHFNTIVEVAEVYGVNPLLLFAITGQEQAFVPKDHPDASKIINNPFNVYVSWQAFNSDLEEAAQIASRTIHTMSEGLPEGEDPIQWINYGGSTETIGYAEDRNWHVGVTTFLEALEAVAGNY